MCLCVCRLLQLLKDESSASKSFYRLQVMFIWIVDLQNNALFSSLCLVLLYTWNAIASLEYPPQPKSLRRVFETMPLQPFQKST